MPGLTDTDVKGIVIATLGAFLGTYQPLNTTAVNIGPAAPKGQTVTGLEAVIDPYPDLESEAHLGGGARATRVWSVTLKGWEHGRGHLQLMPATEAWIAAHPDRNPLSIPGNAELGILAARRLELVEFVYLE